MLWYSSAKVAGPPVPRRPLAPSCSLTTLLVLAHSLGYGHSQIEAERCTQIRTDSPPAQLTRLFPLNVSQFLANIERLTGGSIGGGGVSPKLTCAQPTLRSPFMARVPQVRFPNLGLASLHRALTQSRNSLLPLSKKSEARDFARAPSGSGFRRLR